MAKPPKKDARAGINDIFSLLRQAFQPAPSVHFLIALVILRWFADAKRESRPLPCSLELPGCLEYHTPLTLDDNQLGHWFVAMFEQLEELNKAELGGLFTGLNFASPRFLGNDDSRGLLTRIVENLWFRDRDQCSFELMREALLTSRHCLATCFTAPELNTPASLCELTARVMQPQRDDTVYDPSCGTGQMLIHMQGTLACRPKQVRVYGSERKPAAWIIAKVSALYYGFSSQHIRMADALKPENVLEYEGGQCKFDVVIAHPPWGIKEWRAENPPPERHERFRRGMPPKNNGDYAYLLHMAASMHDFTGRMAAIVSSGVLSRGGQEGRIRMRLLKDNLVDAVVGLPEKMFQGTGVGGALLVMRRSRSARDVLFIDGRGFATTVAGKNVFSPEAIEWIARACAERISKPGVSAQASIEAIIGNDCSLSVSLYVRPEQEHASTDIHAIRYRRKRLRCELSSVNERIDAMLDALMARPA
ncbi:HsdM family class I SAM-dependent methyltransferase [Massilia soli]|uniref:site-specific DNA-methyltransferase (adenine-specific) n=1 Tax=Massilia soli TaxID=2792854 RepID=A0ABS7SLQ5_9BURK|nr:N-6 DNA methylase [Massilia soli]MBZ2206208.1 SAM-dependent methyltransferase [Massilia soli]